jgi:hypothetical protein
MMCLFPLVSKPKAPSPGSTRGLAGVSSQQSRYDPDISVNGTNWIYYIETVHVLWEHTRVNDTYQCNTGQDRPPAH